MEIFDVPKIQSLAARNSQPLTDGKAGKILGTGDMRVFLNKCGSGSP
jgi:hypothetical protein